MCQKSLTFVVVSIALFMITVAAVDMTTLSPSIVLSSTKPPLSPSLPQQEIASGLAATVFQPTTTNPTQTSAEDVTSAKLIEDEKVTIDVKPTLLVEPEKISTSSSEQITDAVNFADTTETVSFGIRSFTVEVTTASEKPPQATPAKLDTPTNQSSDVNKTDTRDVESGAATTTSTITTGQANKETMGTTKIVMPSTSVATPVASTTVTTTTTTTSTVTTPTMRNDLIEDELMSNEIHVEKKLKNGLYRIKIAEITTDEFGGNGLDSHMWDDGAVTPPSEREKRPPYTGGKINIADLYPSQLDDFKPIIQESNRQLIEEKDHLRGGEEEFFKVDENIPTTKIEIELIDDGVTAIGAGLSGTNNKATVITGGDDAIDLTQKLQESDAVISEIQTNFQRFDEHDDEMGGDVGNPTISISTTTSTTTTTTMPVTASQRTSVRVNSPLPLRGSEFIDRRVKKSDPSLKYNIYNSKHNNVTGRIDFVITRFSSELSNSTNSGGNDYKNNEPEFSNSREVYTELNLPPPQQITVEKNKTYQMLPHILKTVALKPLNIVANFEEEPSSPSTTTAKPKIQTLPLFRETEAALVFLNKKVKKSDQQVKTKQQLLRTNKIPVYKANEGITLSQIVNNEATTVADREFSTATTSTTTTTTTTTTTETPVKKQSPVTVTEGVIATATTTVMPPASTSSSSSTSTQKPSGQQIQKPDQVATFLQRPPSPLSRLQERINSLECDIPNLPSDANVWHGNETHELILPITTPEDCSSGIDCLPMIISWEGVVEIQSGDVLIVEIDDKLLIPTPMISNDQYADEHQLHPHDPQQHKTQNEEQSETHKTPTAAVYQVTRLGHEHCDITEGILLDITPLVVDGKKLVTLYDKDLSEGINLLIVVSELWRQQCVRLKVTVKSDNCGENADCTGKGVCFSNISMEGYECQCCSGFAGSHCEEIDACSPSPCTNNGICVDLSQGHEGNSYQCLCPYGYTGKNCQYESDPCNPSQCMNGGSCIGNSTHFRCDCTPGYTGPLCQHNLNECESSPCIHGICVDQEDGFRCFCQPGFAGELCNFEYNECESNPCLNGGQCNDHIGYYLCKCTRGYTGDRCHIKVDFCANNPCPEGHHCADRGDDFTCECPGGRNGPDCNQVPRTLCNVNPCENGGTCWTSEESFYCACRPGFTGKLCEDDFVVETVVSSNEIVSDFGSSATNVHSFGEPAGTVQFGNEIATNHGPIELHNAYIAAGTLAAAIFIVAVIVTVCHCKVHQTYRRFAASRHHQQQQQQQQQYSHSHISIPFFGFMRRSHKSAAAGHRHWLSGKGAVANSTTTTAGIKTGINGGGNGQMCHNGTSPGNQNNNGNGQHCDQRSFTNRPLAMNLENDMYYTVDFSDSQNSPLIQ